MTYLLLYFDSSLAFSPFKVLMIFFSLSLQSLFNSYSSSSNSLLVNYPFLYVMNSFPKLYIFSGTQKVDSAIKSLLQLQK